MVEITSLFKIGKFMSNENKKCSHVAVLIMLTVVISKKAGFTRFSRILRQAKFSQIETRNFPIETIKLLILLVIE